MVVAGGVARHDSKQLSRKIAAATLVVATGEMWAVLGSALIGQVGAMECNPCFTTAHAESGMNAM